MDDEYDSESESDIDELFDYVDTLEDDAEILDKKHYLGTVIKDNDALLLEFRVHEKIFFKFPFELVYGYAYPSYRYPILIMPCLTTNIEIVQVYIIDDCYCVVMKTFWLREFQRKWKKIYKARQLWIRQIRKNPMKYLECVQRTGYYLSNVIKYKN